MIKSDHNANYVHITMQPYMDRVYVSPTAQRLDICAPCERACYNKQTF